MDESRTRQSSKKNLQLIQVLRGIAALLVVFFHATSNAKVILNKNFCFNFFSFGNAGVDIFFVLSGFIITYTSYNAIKKQVNFLPFLRRRFVRIFPTYWIIISLFLLVQIIFPAYYKTHYHFTALNFFSTYFLLPGHTMINGVSWTLSFEIFFYLLFSFAFLISNKKVLFFLAVIFSLIIILFSVFNPQPANQYLGFILFPMNIEFFMGIAAAIIVRHITMKYYVSLIVLGTLLFLISGIFTDNNYYLLPDPLNRVILFGIPSFLIIIGVVKCELVKKIKTHNFFLYLGEASYSLYLIHLPVIVAFYRIISKAGIQNNSLFHFLVFFVIGLICLFSILFYHLVEKHIIIALNQKQKKRVTLKSEGKFQW